MTLLGVGEIPRLEEVFARIFARAAQEAYSTLTVEAARLVVADFDRRLPGWRERPREEAT
jgi:hypothetical protein